MANLFQGERFTFASFNEAQMVREQADFTIDQKGYLTVRDLLMIIFHTDIIWGKDEPWIDRLGWLDTLGWKVKETGYFWVLDTPNPVEINELGVKND